MKAYTTQLLFAFTILLSLTSPIAAQADTSAFPSRSVKIVVGFPAGGSSDITARILAERLANEWNNTVFVENRAGAGGTIAASYVAAAPADGYTLLLIAPGTHAVSSAMYDKLPYDPIKSFSSISQIAKGPYFVLVNSASNIKSMADLITQAKASPGKVTFASTGKGSGAHFVGESIAQASGAKLLHVPYNGAAPATLALLSGQVDIAISDMSAMPNILNGKLRALAVTTPQRFAQQPAIPTLAESGIPVEYTVSVGIAGPAGIPSDIVKKINASIARALQNDDAKKQLRTLGFEATPTSSDELAKIIAGDVKRFGAFIQQAGLKQP